MTSLRETVLAKLVRARAVLETLQYQSDAPESAIEWQKGYVKAFEEILDVEALTLRRYPRRLTIIPTEIARMLPESSALGQQDAGTITDLSLEGCGLTTAMALAWGERVEIAFTLPERGTPVMLEGWVRRAQKRGEESRVGVEFTGLSEGTAAALQAFLTGPLPAGGAGHRVP